MKKNLMALGVATTCVMMSATGAQAFNFTTQASNFDPISTANPKEDIFLKSITVGNKVIEDFVFVTSATINQNDPRDLNAADNTNNSGAASSDLGDNATVGVKAEDPNATNVVQSLGNNNLNSIIDTEDKGSFEITLEFGKAINNFLFWERGGNSKLGVRVGDKEVILDSGNPFMVGSKTNETFTDAAFDIDTTEIGSKQSVFSYGLSLADLGLGRAKTITVFSNGSSFNGPDFKVVGAQVPEPATMLGLGLVAGAGFLASRRKQAEA
ncbi:exosortase-dependent surface protein XDP2 [Halomicronema sp. CCY15110]|uniref:exosortase-dependent surface protein XDP2 n=1 Tax=Halomicronema sp. CCY15110 TaxID=2767773 RepID=UPI001EF37242|nr:exosortase-dependent surface protein XDP2 [Halomicronema sp. CCY15110]